MELRVRRACISRPNSHFDLFLNRRSILRILPCVKTVCCDCNAVEYPSAGIVARRLGMPLTDWVAPQISQGVGCLSCGSKRVDVYYAHQNRLIVAADTNRFCRVCDNPISEPFLSVFSNADFCLQCVVDGKITDSDVVGANGTLFAGEAYRAMATQLRVDDQLRIGWLRKAVREGDIAACSTLGDLLSRSEEQSDLAEAASAYRKAAEQKAEGSVVRYAQHRLALMLLQGRGMPVDTEAAVDLLYSSADNGASYALSDLAKFIFNNEFGLGPDNRRAFELFSHASEMNPDGMMDNASVALMLLLGIGVDADFEKGSEKLKSAISIYAKNKPAFDAGMCFEQVITALSASDGAGLDLPLARTYLDWMVRFKVPGAARLLDICGGPLPPREPKQELFLSKVLPDKVKGSIWWVKSPVRDRLGQPSILGQIERLPDRLWIATTDHGLPVGKTFGSDKLAIQALAEVHNCEIPFVDFETKVRRMNATT